MKQKRTEKKYDLFLQRGLEDIAPIKKKKQEAKKEVFTEN